MSFSDRILGKVGRKGRQSLSLFVITALAVL